MLFFQHRQSIWRNVYLDADRVINWFIRRTLSDSDTRLSVSLYVFQTCIKMH